MLWPARHRGSLPFCVTAAKDRVVSDRDDFRARATEIFRQLRLQGNAAPSETEEEPSPEPGGEQTPNQPASRVLPEPPPAAPAVSLTDDTPVDGILLPPPKAWTPELEELSESVDENAKDRPEALLRRVLSVGPAEPIPFGADPRETGPPNPDLAVVSAAPEATTADVPRSGSVYGRHREPRPGETSTGHTPSSAPIEPGVAAPAPKVAIGAPAGLPVSTLRLDPLADIDLGEEDPPQWTPGSKHPGSSRPLPRILAIANQKGGVGKTTTAVNLGAALAELHYRVLVVDLDPQGNATTGLGINGRNLDASVYDVILHETPIEDVIEPTTLRNLFVVPATIDLAGAEIELVPVFSREMRLRKALDSVRDDFDFMLIDCPPSLGLLTVNGLAAATEVVVPIQCEYYALEGLSQLLRNVNLVQGNLNAGLELSTIILTMYDARTRLAEQVVGEVRSHFGARVCRNVVPRTVRLSEAPSFGQPIIVFDSSSRGAIAYRELAKEVSGGAPQRVR
jgi:chromosome partitioning protein